MYCNCDKQGCSNLAAEEELRKSHQRIKPERISGKRSIRENNKKELYIMSDVQEGTYK